jgi:predicted PhzF superfamily epimerase YddE/YHI9
MHCIHAPNASPEQLAARLGLAEVDLGTQPLWVNTGVEQLIVPSRSAEAVRRTRPDPLPLSRHGSTAER